jgi:hypothetical protein
MQSDALGETLPQQHVQSVRRGFLRSPSQVTSPNKEAFAMSRKCIARILQGVLFVSPLAITIVASGQASSTVSSVTETVIHRFKGNKGDAIQPSTALSGVLGSNGQFSALYGAASVGASEDGGCAGGGCGAVFELTPPDSGAQWVETLPASFAQSNGAVPSGGLLLAPSPSSAVGPTIFGTTLYGGTGSDTSSPFTGNGTVFSLSGNALTTLWYFSGNADENSPSGSLITDNAAGVPGAVYGTTRGGHSPAYGTVFSVQDSINSLSTIWTFSNTDGKRPLSGLLADKKGALYGTAYEGGPNSVGSVFKLTPPGHGQTAWTEQILWAFTGTTDGGNPEQPDALIMDKSGALYGTALTGGLNNTFCGATGCGVVYKLTPPASGSGSWTQQVLWSFTGGNDGAYPIGGLIMDSKGVLYGTANGGGNVANTKCAYQAFDTGCGVVYKLTPPSNSSTAWTETTLWVFGNTATDGTNPVGDLLPDQHGTLYGVTAGGGKEHKECKGGGCGTVYQLTDTGFRN